MSIRTIFFMAFGLFLLYGLFTIGFPFLLALLFVVLLEPIVQYLIKFFKISRPISAVIVSSLFSLLVFLSLILLISKAAKEAVGLSGSIMKILRQMATDADVYIAQTEIFFRSIPPEYQESLSQVLRNLLEALQGLLGNLAGYSINIASAIPYLLIETLVFFIAFYIISFSLPNIKKGFLSLFDPSTHHRIDIVMGNLYKAVIGFIRGQFIISILIFFVTSLAFYVLKVKYVLATALLVTFVDILPVFGAGSVIVPMAIYNFVEAQPLLGIGLLIQYGFLIVLRRILEPKILGDAMGIGALSALVSMYIGFKLTGFIGLILGPTVIIIYQALVNEGVIKINIKF